MYDGGLLAVFIDVFFVRCASFLYPIEASTGR